VISFVFFIDPITLSEVFAIDSAVDVSDMLDFGGPSLVQAIIRVGMTILL
jgi:hypothetical protein